MCQNQASGTYPLLPPEKDKEWPEKEVMEEQVTRVGKAVTSPRTWQTASQEGGWTAGWTPSHSSQGAQALFQLLLPPWTPSSPSILVLVPGLQSAGGCPYVKPHAHGVGKAQHASSLQGV